MTDKVTEKEGKVDSSALQNLTTANESTAVSQMRIPHDTDIENLKKHFVSSQHSNHSMSDRLTVYR